ncbi:MAG: hypothetical protein OMM_14153 [Candidatus Magnetoglobus multicellularis str. Araruama]|uniref:Uncharacterized protein n=1 Tax=Candidatus Magnetoglobus multicellularis str. Araruama TaxID=890399 RepID=A0A1V1NSG6_9BACT|nr:MAG: hypothetical protein OMM_14153 [Candidatus Magnetoglobus multicellularis str. Araruama]
METRRRPQIFPKDSILISGSSNEASSYDSSITSIINLPSIFLVYGHQSKEAIYCDSRISLKSFRYMVIKMSS